VIIAAQDAIPSLRKGVAALLPQLPPDEMEILVVDGSGAGPVIEQLAREFPTVRVLSKTAESNVPQLWSTGIAAAGGNIIALTIENCVPAADWADQILARHLTDCAAAGGAIELAPGTTLADWAVYFSRYSNYVLPFQPRFLDDLPGDNCAYKRTVLEPVRHLMDDGFWETFIHYDMRRRNLQLLSDPAPVVTYCGGLSWWRFFRRRYRHGRYFAARRAREFTRSQRLVRAAGFWAVPPLLFKRIAGRVWSNGRHRGKFLAALPLVMSFLAAWAAGEGIGYLTGSKGAGAPERD
jgi:hypothetical protein